MVEGLRRVELDLRNKTSKLKRRNAETETIVKSKTEVRPQNTETAHYFTQKKSQEVFYNAIYNVYIADLALKVKLVTIIR